MALRNSHKKNNSDDQFDLDNYINEKSTGESENLHYDAPLDSKSSRFKNTVLIIGLVFFTILYFNDWSIKQVFGFNDYQEVTTTSQLSPNGDILVTGNVDDATLAGLAKLQELQKLGELEGLAKLGALQNLQGLEALQELESLQDIESDLAGIENLEQPNDIRIFALETAIEALKGIENSGAFGSEAQLGFQEALKELESLREIENTDFDQTVSDPTNLTSSFQEYSDELTELGISNIFEESDLQKLHQANVPSTFLKQLEELNLIEKLSTDSIIEAFNSRD